MADALMSPAVGGATWVVAGAAIAYSARKVRHELDESKIPLMGIAGAFVFAAQMLNFTIPGTGSSGHLVGALLLAILLGRHAALIVMASILAVQALFFADGGLLALGANMVNMGVIPIFIAYPLIYRRIAGDGPAFSQTRIAVGSILAAIIGLQLGAVAVVLETTASGIAELPFWLFIGAMLPMHLAIGAVEGVVTAVVVLFVLKAQPELLVRSAASKPLAGLRMKPVIIGLAAVAVVAAVALSWFASSYSDGLEWSIAKVTGNEQELATASSAHKAAADLQGSTSFLPDYAFRADEPAADEAAAGDEPGWPAVDAGTSVSGLVGGAIVAGIVVLVGFVLHRRSTRRQAGART
jgi:cobalt/nickel transport system permease protein